MIVLNGNVYADLNSAPSNDLQAILQAANPFKESVRVEAGKIVFWEAHYFRMMASMRILRMGIPMTYTMEYLEEQVLLLLQESDLLKKSVQIHFSFFSTDSISRFNPIVTSSFLIHAKACETMLGIQTSDRSIDLYKDYWVVKGLYGTLEQSNDRLRKLASVYAFENDFEDCVLLNEDKQITETITGAIFVVKGNQIKTPPLTSGCRSSVYRQVVIDLLVKQDGLDLVEDVVSPFELQKADELFVVSLSNGIQSVKQYRKKVFVSTTAESLFSKFIMGYRLS
ncbi:aminotransferase class IV [Flavobacteriaceae bacterium]|nr:aminotransferase class IV [Flavobacteriaceae bacterium]MDC1460482.1 aminotransferase class IV [Flavobacteriaceae bacterium]